MSEFFLEITFDKLKSVIADRIEKPVAMIDCNENGLFSVTLTVRMNQKYRIVKKKGSSCFKQIESLLVMLRDSGIDKVKISGVSHVKDDRITKQRKQAKKRKTS